MLTIFAVEGKIVRLDEETGDSWLLVDDDDGNVEWVAIKNRADKTDEEK